MQCRLFEANLGEEHALQCKIIIEIDNALCSSSYKRRKYQKAAKEFTMCRHLLCAGICYVQALAVCRHLLCAGTCYVQALAMCRHLLCAGTCYVQALAMCRHLLCAGTCCLQALAVCRHAGTCYVQALAVCRHIHDSCLLRSPHRNITGEINHFALRI